MNFQASPHFDFGPLWALCGYRTQGELAEALGTTKKTIGRWRQEGIPLHSADRAACRLGFHPADIWSDWGVM